MAYLPGGDAGPPALLLRCVGSRHLDSLSCCLAVCVQGRTPHPAMGGSQVCRVDAPAARCTSCAQLLRAVLQCVRLGVLRCAR